MIPAHRSPAAFLRWPGLVVAMTMLLGGSAMAATPASFTATYKVLRGGSDIGESTLALRADANGQWTYTSSLRGTSGMAALLGASVKEASTFRWRDGRPEAVSYDYALDAAIKHKHRHVDVDWARGQVAVDDGKKGHFDFASQPGMVERHLLPLALGYVLADAGKTQVTLPVAVQNRVQMQSFEVAGKEPVDVPAGHFDAVRVDRTDDDKGFSAWYMPDRYPVPVKLAQSAGGNITMLLKSFNAR